MASKADDPFERVAKAASEGGSAVAPAGAAKVRDPGEHIAPVPANAPALPSDWAKLGQPSASWAYCDASGRVLRWTLRFVTAAGEKDIRPVTLWREKPGHPMVWRFKGEPGLRPLYGLDRLANRPSAPVLVVEGEKAADAAGERFSDFVAMTWPGGSNAVSKADFGPLHGRHVVVFPDADDPGKKASQAVAKAAIAAGALSAAVVDVPGFLPQGWDLADEWPDGFSDVAAATAIQVARDRAAPAGVVWPWGYRMEPDGLYFDQPVKDGATIAQRLAAPFDILGEARDSDGGDWSVVLCFKDRDGREKTIPVSRSRLASGSAEVRAELAGGGLVVSPARGKADKFSIALAEVECKRRLILASATGWCGGRFVLPNNVVGAVDAEPVLYTGATQALRYRKMGSLEGWRDGIASKADGNSLLTFALSLAFLGPLLRPLELEGGGVNLRGSSSCGKTTLALAAGSVWGGGGPSGFAQTWKNTSNALESVASGHNDCLLVLDELALIQPEEAGGAAYTLASGQAKGRLHANSTLRNRAEFRVAILSTGEISLADHIRSAKKGERPMTGQELRILDIAADAGAHMGVWEVLHGAEKPATFSDAIKTSCARDYGHAGAAFLESFIARREEALNAARTIMAGFLKKAAREGDSGQAYRAALRFASIAAAGELATLFGVVPWKAGQASAAALRLFHRWADAFGRDSSREDREILQRLRDVIESKRAMFSPLGDDDTSDDAMPSVGGRDGEARALETYGYRRVSGAFRETRYLFTTSGWAIVFKGIDPKEAARVVRDAGFLEVDTGESRLKKTVSIKGIKQKLYCIDPAILGADLGD